MDPRTAPEAPAAANSSRRQTWIERNPRKAILGTILALTVLADLLAGHFLIPEQFTSFRRPHEYYHHGFYPDRDAVDSWAEREYQIVTNSLALRDSRTGAVALEPEGRRIVLIGDSFVEGQGLPFDETVVGRLREELAGEPIEVLNAAVASYSPKLHRLKIEHLIEHQGLRFDTLVQLIDISDMQNEILYKYFEPREIPFFQRLRFRADRALGTHSYLYYLVGRLLDEEPLGAGNSIFGQPMDSYSEIEQGIVERSYDYNFLASWTYVPRRFERYGAEGLRLAAENTTKLHELCRKHGITPIVVVYPWPQQIRRRQLDCPQVTFWRTFCQEHDVQFVNLFPAFIDARPADEVCSRYFIPRDVHWNREGSALVAEKLAEALLDERPDGR